MKLGWLVFASKRPHNKFLNSICEIHLSNFIQATPLAQMILMKLLIRTKTKNGGKIVMEIGF